MNPDPQRNWACLAIFMSWWLRTGQTLSCTGSTLREGGQGSKVTSCPVSSSVSPALRSHVEKGSEAVFPRWLERGEGKQLPRHPGTGPPVSSLLTGPPVSSLLTSGSSGAVGLKVMVLCRWDLGSGTEHRGYPRTHHIVPGGGLGDTVTQGTPSL